jgi:hypothetical protein
MTQAGARDEAERPWLTLTEAATLSGRHIDALRAMARRGRIERRKNNAGQWVVRLPESWPQAGMAGALGNAPSDSGNALGGAQGDDSGTGEALAELREEAAELRVALARAESRAEAMTAVAKGEVEAVKRVAAAEVESMREQLQAGVAARNAVIADLRAELARLRLPFWRRWLG